MDKKSQLYVAAKRGLDIAVASGGLVALAPLFVAVAAIIKLDSSGPVFYRGVRVGKDGRLFRIWKFRTMVRDAERLGGSCTPDDDVRITRAGQLLRKHKIDELPQLLNVLAGAMSLVGSRPDVQAYAARLRGEERAILDLKPGITDWASIWDSDEGGLLAGQMDPEAYYEEHILPTKIRLQLHYSHTCSFLGDLKILSYTAAKLAIGRWMPHELEEYLAAAGRHTDESSRQNRGL